MATTRNNSKEMSKLELAKKFAGKAIGWAGASFTGAGVGYEVGKAAHNNNEIVRYQEKSVVIVKRDEDISTKELILIIFFVWIMLIIALAVKNFCKNRMRPRRNNTNGNRQSESHELQDVTSQV